MRARARRGIAIASALCGIVIVGLLAAGIFTVVDLDAGAARARERSARAALLAEAASTHAIAALSRDSVLQSLSLTALLRGRDSITATADDGYLDGYATDTSILIPAVGRAVPDGRYVVQVLDDPAEGDADSLTDANGRVMLRCSAVTPDSARATLDVVVAAPALPAVAAGGYLEITGNPIIEGRCGSVHANSSITNSGTTRLAGTFSSSATVSNDGSIQTLSGGTLSPAHDRPPLPIPATDPLTLCADADYVLGPTGVITRAGTGQTWNAAGAEHFGWTYLGGGRWTLAGANAAAGTFCAHGSVVVTGNPGEATAQPLPLTILASGSIDMPGSPRIVPAHPDSIALMAGGDIGIAGTPHAGFSNLVGLIYAGAQCRVGGTPRIAGQLVCRNGADPAGSLDITGASRITGSPTISYDCGGLMGARKRIVAWYPRLGS